MGKKSFFGFKPRYSRAWAASIVEKVAEKYPRGLTFSLEVFDFQIGDIERILASGSKIWHYFHDVAKEYDSSPKALNCEGSVFLFVLNDARQLIEWELRAGRGSMNDWERNFLLDRLAILTR